MENNCKRLSVAGCKHNLPRARFHFNVLSFLEEKLAVKYCVTVILDHGQPVTSEVQGKRILTQDLIGIAVGIADD